MRAALGEIKDEMRRRRHDSLTDQGRWLRSVVAPRAVALKIKQLVQNAVHRNPHLRQSAAPA
jgi:hypothetical protein